MLDFEATTKICASAVIQVLNVFLNDLYVVVRFARKIRKCEVASVFRAPQNTIRPPNPDAKTTTKLDVKMYEVRRDVMVGNAAKKNTRESIHPFSSPQATLLSEAAELRDNATDVREAVEKCADYLNRLKALLFEVKNCLSFGRSNRQRCS